MALILFVPLAVPLFLAILGLVPRAYRLRRFSGVLSSSTVLASGVVLVAADRAGSAVTALAGVLRADALSAYLLAVIGAVGLVATWGGLARRRAKDEHSIADSTLSLRGGYEALIAIFLAAMSLAVISDSLGVMWVAVEATTIATAFLVSHSRNVRSLEAAWKYVVLGSVGIAVAFLGVVLIYASSTGTSTPTLSWIALGELHGQLDPGLLRVGAALAVLGFATKAGLAPMHSWLPDAHSQAPAEVSALMSGVLLSVALYAIMRIQAVADLVIGPGFLRAILVVGGLLSLAIAAALLLRQRDYKRMLAYSSIEHMGVMALGVAIGPSALAAVLIYMLCHGLIKSSLFILSGRMLAVEGTSRIAEVRSLLVRRPGLAVPWLIGITALLGFPPFGIFFAELVILFAGWAAGLGVAMAIAIALMLIIFAGLTRSTVRMVFGSADPPDRERESSLGSNADRFSHGPRLPLVLAFVAAAIVPFLAAPVGSALVSAVSALGRVSS